ncbi:MAG: RAMP superfamily CRISPR-associated protein [Pseudomonadota bacterium]
MTTPPPSPETIPARWSAQAARGVTQRIVATSTLRFREAVRLASGDPATLVDEKLLRDAASGRPLLTGTTLAGALRALLAQFTDDPALVDALFGTAHEDALAPSLVIVDDSVAAEGTVEVREGVKLDGATRTAHDGALYDAEAWAADVQFPLRLELVLTEHHADTTVQLTRAFATLLDLVQSEGLTLGARKRRGFGLAHAAPWRVRRFDLTTADGLLDWVEAPAPRDSDTAVSVATALQVDPLVDQRHVATLEASFIVPGSLLIRAGTGDDDRSSDMVHLHALRTGSEARTPIVSGTSWAGALRTQATRILRLLGSDAAAKHAVDDLFGPDLHAERDVAPGKRVAPRGSRLHVRTSEVTGGTSDLVQHRVSIDRFTGGAYPGALFNQQPLFGNGQATLTLRIRVEHPTDADLGLLCLLLKDLWTGLLPIGGERSVGRGRLRGRAATLTLRGRDEPQVFDLNAGEDGAVQTTDAERTALEGFVAALHKSLASTSSISAAHA